MQTCEDFLGHGLAPIPTSVLSTLTGPDLDCTICSETLADPVCLPCHHIFDKACITHWLQMPDRSPMVYRAMREAGLAVDQPGNIELFYIPRPSDSAMARAAPAAAQYLIHSSDPRQVTQVQETGPAQINANALAAHLVAMGNLLPALSRERGSPYTRREAEDWETLVDRLYVLLLRKNGKRYDALVMAEQLRQRMKLRGLMLHHDVEVSGFIITENGLTAELDTLLSYVTYVSFHYVADQERARQAARGAVAGGRGQRRRDRCAVM